MSKDEIQQGIISLLTYTGMQVDVKQWAVPYPADLYVSLTPNMEVGDLISGFLKGSYSRGLKDFLRFCSRVPRKVAFEIKPQVKSEQEIKYAYVRAKEDIYRIYFLLNRFPEKIDFFVYISDLGYENLKLLQEEFFRGEDSASNFLRRHLLVTNIETVRMACRSLYSLIEQVLERIKAEAKEKGTTVTAEKRVEAITERDGGLLAPSEFWKRLAQLYQEKTIRTEAVWDVLLYGFAIAGYFVLPNELKWTGILAQAARDLGVLVLKPPKPQKSSRTKR